MLTTIKIFTIDLRLIGQRIGNNRGQIGLFFIVVIVSFSESFLVWSGRRGHIDKAISFHFVIDMVFQSQIIMIMISMGYKNITHPPFLVEKPSKSDVN